MSNEQKPNMSKVLSYIFDTIVDGLHIDRVVLFLSRLLRGGKHDGK